MRSSRRVAGAVCSLLLAASIGVNAQSSPKMRKIGHVIATVGKCEPEKRDEAFLASLAKLGYVVGRNLIVERRCFRNLEEGRRVLNELVALKVEVLFVGGPAIALAARDATKDIPIVCGSCGDPVENGVVASLARPGANVTGLASMSAELIGKRVELMKEAIPRLTQLAVLVFAGNPGNRSTLTLVDAAGRALGVKIQRIDVRGADDLEGAFKAAAAAGSGAVLIPDDPLSFSARKQIADLALKHRLPSIAGQPQQAEAGMLIAYGPDRTDLYRRAAEFVDKLLKGAKASALSMEQPTKFDFVVNLKTAQAMGLTIPQSILARADAVIQ